MKNNYHDMYFEHHHWLLKIRQTLIMLLSWCILLIPIITTISTYLAYRTNGHQGHFFWYYAEGFRELNFLVIILLFALGMIGIFCITMGYIQAQRTRGLTTKWPMFDINKSHLQRQRAEAFMTKQFGDPEMRTNTRNFVVKPEQNLTKNQLRDIVNNHIGDDKDGF